METWAVRGLAVHTVSRIGIRSLEAGVVESERFQHVVVKGRFVGLPGCRLDDGAKDQIVGAGIPLLNARLAIQALSKGFLDHFVGSFHGGRNR